MTHNIEVVLGRLKKQARAGMGLRPVKCLRYPQDIGRAKLSPLFYGMPGFSSAFERVNIAHLKPFSSGEAVTLLPREDVSTPQPVSGAIP